jgi:signal transduction histidine kinase
VAQEINSPIGYLDNNISRLDNYFTDLRHILVAADAALAELPEEISKPAQTEISAIKKRLDFDFLTEDFPIVISDCREGVVKIKEIVQSLKDFSHNMDEKTVTEVDINTAINTTLKVLNNEIKYYCDIELDLHLENKVPGNVGQIHQVLSNIIVNASQSMRETGKRGILSIGSFVEDNFAVIEIEDTGAGIPEDIYTKIFDPFFTTKPLGQGAGLGLNIAYDIVVNKHKGDLSFVSKVGAGSLFKIKLPLNFTPKTILKNKEK